jgi:hypothetical protein
MHAVQSQFFRIVFTTSTGTIFWLTIFSCPLDRGDAQLFLADSQCAALGIGRLSASFGFSNPENGHEIVLPVYSAWSLL